MGFLKKRNETLEFNIMKELDNRVNSLLELDSFISRKAFVSIINEGKKTYDDLMILKNQGVLKTWCKQNSVDIKIIEIYLNNFSNIELNIKNHNDAYVSRHLKDDKEYLDGILFDDDPKIALDNNQREAVLRDEDYTLIVAGAGAGKTTTIEAKVKYLIEKKNVNPNDILIISFTKKATRELAERFMKLKLNPVISTFHSTGFKIIASESDEKYDIVSQGFMFNVIKNYLKNDIVENDLLNKIILFFSSYLNFSGNQDNLDVLYKELSSGKETLKSDIESAIESYKDIQTKNNKTLKNESVRSTQECNIANYLYTHNINYEYESIYPFMFKDSRRVYTPDFKITQGDKVVYYEHFALSEDGKNNRFNEDELAKYQKGANEKIKLHKEHGTKLIYTYSKYNDGRDVISHLHDELVKAGISLEMKNSKEIYKQITDTLEDKYLLRFIQLVCVFINRFKTSNFSLSKFDEWKLTLKDERTKLFVDICYKCYLAYDVELKKNNFIDFEDMINKAAHILDEKIKNNERLPYQYILVDEYQDISLQRFDLAEKLSKCCDAKILAVGDDFQSIYRFSGSRIELFTDFEKKMGYADMLKILKTYRNSQELCDIAGGFIMKNDKQIKKKLESPKHIDNPVILMSYDDSYNKEEPTTIKLAKTIEKALDHIVENQPNKKDVLLIGRYGFETYTLSKATDYFIYNEKYNTVKSIKYPDLEIRFMTAHSSKGLGADNVIVINGKDDIFGFPSKIEDDPVMKLAIKENEDMDFAEERRLFYVALTRTKNRVYIMTPKFHPSEFILEIKKEFNNILLDGEELSPQQIERYRLKCPYCGFPLQKRTNKDIKIYGLDKTIYVCSNDPEVCGFVTNNITGGKLFIKVCPMCKDGYLVVKKKVVEKVDTGKRFLGCTNYKLDKTGCNHTENEFDDDSTEYKPEFFNANLSIDKVFICGDSIKKTIEKIIYTTNYITNNISNFKPNKTVVADILLGNISKTIETVKVLQSISTFGNIDTKYHDNLIALLAAMTRAGIIVVDNNNYNSISLAKSKFTDEDYIEILSSIKY